MSYNSSTLEEKKRLFSLGYFSKKHCILFIIHPFCHVLYEFFLMKYEGEMTIKYFSNYFGNILINGIMLIIYQKEYSFNCGKKKIR